MKKSLKLATEGTEGRSLNVSQGSCRPGLRKPLAQNSASLHKKSMRFPFYLRNRLLRNNILPQYSNILQVERNMKYSFANGMFTITQINSELLLPFV